jgi:hypothetical protein
VAVHLEGELEHLIAQVQDQELRSKFMYLLNHPIGENIGSRSDIIRLLYGVLYLERSDHTDGSQNAEFNIHMDIDNLEALSFERARRALKIKKRRWLRRPRGFSDIERKQIQLKAMEKSIAAPPAAGKLPPSLKEKIAKVLDRLPKLWGLASNPTDQPVAITDELRILGYFSNNMENNVLGISPFHPTALSIVEQTYWQLQTGGSIDPAPSDRANAAFIAITAPELRDAAKDLYNMRHGTPEHNDFPDFDQDRMVDYFRLAEGICQIKDQIQDTINEMIDAIGRVSSSQQEKDALSARVLAISAIYDTSSDLVYYFINLNTYSPQISNFSIDEYQVMRRMSRSIFGSKPPSIIGTGTWKGGSLTIHGVKYDFNDVTPEDMRLAFDQITGMIRARTTDDLPFS